MQLKYKALSIFFILLVSFSFSLSVAEVTQKINDLHLLKSIDIEGVTEEVYISEDSIVTLSGTSYWVASLSSGAFSTPSYFVIDDKKPMDLVSDSKFEQIIKQKVFFDYLAGKELYYSSTLTNYFLELSTELDKMTYNLDLFKKYLEDENIDITKISAKLNALKQDITAIKKSSDYANQESNNLEGILITLKKEIPGYLSKDMFDSAQKLSNCAADIYSKSKSMEQKIQEIKSLLVDLNIDVSKKSVLVNFLSVSPLLLGFSAKKEVIDSSFSNVQKAHNQSENKSFIKKLVNEWVQRGYRSQWFKSYYMEDKEIKSKTKYATLDAAVSSVLQTKSEWVSELAMGLNGKKDAMSAYVSKGNYKDALLLSKEIKEDVLTIYSLGKKPIEEKDTPTQNKSYLYYILFGVVGIMVVIIGYKLFKKYATKEEEPEEEEEYKIEF